MVGPEHQIPGLPKPDKPVNKLKGPKGPLQHRCQTCRKPETSLLRCSGCKVVRYCSKNHQTQAWPKHKSICSMIKKCRKKLGKEDHAVRNATADFATPANAFESSVGHFWGIFSTRNYMWARLDLADTIRRLGTLDGVTEGLEHMRDMLRLCRSDNMGLRDLAPSMMLQLDLDQECYDFIKWWKLVDPDGKYDWGNTELPYLDTKDANVLEPVEYLKSKYGEVHHLATMLLLKLKLLVDIINIKITRKVIAPRLPTELWKRVELDIIRSPLSKQWTGKSYREITAVQQKLERQIKLIASYVQTANDNFIHMLFDAEEYLSEMPGAYSPGSFEEVQLVLQYSYPAWWEHKGVLDLLESARTIAGLDSESEIVDMMESKTFKTQPGSARSKEELLADVSRNRMWGYFDDAVADAYYLGKVKPSQVNRERAHAAYLQAMEDEQDFDESDSED